MAYLFSASFVVFVLAAASTGFANDDESSIPQMPPDGSSQAFVVQLPETAIVPATSSSVPIKTALHGNPKQHSSRPSIAVHSIFPNIGVGVNARASTDPAGVRLPTVGGGVTQSL